MPDPIFTFVSVNTFGLSDVGTFASPTLVDIDGDGDLDAFVGEWLGNTLFFRNTGTTSNPAFDAPISNPFGLINVGHYANPTLVDIDGDGDCTSSKHIGLKSGRIKRWFSSSVLG